MSLTSLFCDIDDFCLEFEPEWHKQLLTHNSKLPSGSKLSLSEIMTIVVDFHRSAYRNFKHFYLKMFCQTTEQPYRTSFLTTVLWS